MKRVMMWAMAALLAAGGAAGAEEKEADEPLIPAALNALLPRIKAGMTAADIQLLLFKPYPESTRQDGPSSGRSGNIGFRLNDRYWFMIATRRNSEDQQVIDHDARIYVFDMLHHHRLEITHYRWKDSHDETSPKQ